MSASRRAASRGRTINRIFGGPGVVAARSAENSASPHPRRIGALQRPDHASDRLRRRRRVKGRPKAEREPERQRRLGATLEAPVTAWNPRRCRAHRRRRCNNQLGRRWRREREAREAARIGRPRIQAGGSSPWNRRASPTRMRRSTLAGRSGTAVDGVLAGGRSVPPPHLGSSRSLRTCSVPMRALICTPSSPGR